MDKRQRVTGYITNRDLGRVDFSGTVTDTYRSGRQALVVVACDDGIERHALEENVTPEAQNIRTHTGVVHAPGRSFKQLRGGVAPKCCASAGAVSRYHFLIPTSQPVTCRRCLAALAKEATK